MTRTKLLIAALLCVLPPMARADEPLALRRVMLSSGGVGYFETAGTATGAASLSLEVPVDQIDDLLKSLVVFDDRGAVAGISLPGRTPRGQSLKDLAFVEEDFAEPHGLIAKLRGAEVSVAGAQPMTGRIVAVVPDLVDGPSDQPRPERHRVTLATAEGLKSFVLETAEGVAFTDKELSRDMATALERLASARVSGKRTLTVRTTGPDGVARPIRVGYMAAAPLWKVTYRLTLPDRPGAPAHIQGWAVVENRSGQAWKGVDLTLLAGNPTTFRQALYDSYMVDRPSVPVDVVGRVLPSADEAQAREAAPKREAASAPRAMMPAPVASAMPAPAPPPGGMSDLQPSEAPMPPITAEAKEAATQLSLHIGQPVDLPDGSSALLPILDADLAGLTVGLMQRETPGDHPLAALSLTNATGASLPPGTATVYRHDEKLGAVYVGDARLGLVPPGETRLLAFAVDGAASVTRVLDPPVDGFTASVAKGVLIKTVESLQTTRFEATAPKGEGRALIIEVPRHFGWDLVEPTEGVETAGEVYRVRVTLNPGEHAAGRLVQRATREQRLTLLDLDERSLTALSIDIKNNPKLREWLTDLAEQRRAIGRDGQELQRLAEARKTLAADQERVRQNLATVGHDSALSKRLLDKLGGLETDIEKNAIASDDLIRRIDTAKVALAAAIARFGP